MAELNYEWVLRNPWTWVDPNGLLSIYVRWMGLGPAAEIGHMTQSHIFFDNVVDQRESNIQQAANTGVAIAQAMGSVAYAAVSNAPGLGTAANAIELGQGAVAAGQHAADGNLAAALKAAAAAGGAYAGWQLIKKLNCPTKKPNNHGDDPFGPDDAYLNPHADAGTPKLHCGE